MKAAKEKGHVLNRAMLPALWPTHGHNSEFWERLGRTVATFGFLEEALGKAVFAFTATRTYPRTEIHEAYEAWIPTLERALYDTLGSLIDSYAKAVRGHPSAIVTNLDDLVAELRKAAEIRNVLCHGSWRAPNANGASVPFFVNRKLMIFDNSIDAACLKQVRAHAAKLTCGVIDTVTTAGLQFPGSRGPGNPIV